MEGKCVRKIGSYYCKGTCGDRVPGQPQGTVEDGCTGREGGEVCLYFVLPSRLVLDVSIPIPRTRHLPKSVYQASKLKRTMLDAQRVKDERRRKHTRAGETKPKAARKKVVLVEQT